MSHLSPTMNTMTKTPAYAAEHARAEAEDDRAQAALKAARPLRITAAERWRQSQACLVALAIDRAWGAVENALEREPEAVLLSLRHLVSDGAVPSKRALVNVCRRRRAQNGVAAAAAASPADVDCWPDDMLAAIASRKLARPSKRPGAATAGYVAALTAAAALYERVSKRDQQAAKAAPSMDALRKAKGAL